MKFVHKYALFLMLVFNTSGKAQNKTDLPQDDIFSETKDVIASHRPYRMVRTIKQDRNGKIWLATSEGIIRYDRKLLRGILPKGIMKEGKVYQLETKTPRGGCIWAMDWSPNDKFLAVASLDGHVRIYDAQTLELIKILSGHSKTVNSVH